MIFQKSPKIEAAATGHTNAVGTMIALQSIRLLRALLFLLPLLATAQAEEPTILVLGDSLSSAHGMATEDGWVSLLQRRLEELGYPHGVVNASVSGETSTGGRARLPAALKTHRPEIVLLELGGNDGLLGLPVNTLADNLDALVRHSQDAKARVLILGIRIPPNYGPVYAEQFASVFTAIAERYQLPLVPFLLEGIALEPSLMQGDGIHPKAEAQPRILQTVWMELEPLLEQE